MLETKENEKTNTSFILSNHKYWVSDSSLRFFDENKKLHRNPDEGPAVQKDGGYLNKGTDEYFVHGLEHNEYGPSHLSQNYFYSKQSKTRKYATTERWKVFGEFHRNPHDGPAYITEDSYRNFEEWWVDGNKFEFPAEAIQYYDSFSRKFKNLKSKYFLEL